MRTCLSIAFTAWLIALSTASPALAEVYNRVVAIVGKDIITLAEVDSRLGDRLDRLAKSFRGQALKDKQMKLRNQALQSLIEERLAVAEGNKAGIEVQDSQVDAYVQQILKDNKMTRNDMEKALALEGLTWKTWRAQMKVRILKSMLVQQFVTARIFISPEAKRTLYESRSEQYKGDEQVVLRRIVLGNDQGELAITVKSKLDSGQDFAEMAKEFSISPDASKGGLLGSFSIDQLSSSIQKAVKGLKKGEHTAPIQSRGGYQIFQVADRIIVSGKSFDDVEEQLTRELTEKEMQTKFREWITEVRERSFVKILGFSDSE